MSKSTFINLFILQLIGWGTYYLIAVGSHSLFAGGIHNNGIYFARYNIFIATGFCFSFFLFFIYEYFQTRIREHIYFIPIILIASFIIALIWAFLYKFSLVIILAHKSAQLSENTYLHLAFNGLPVYLIWSAVYFLINYSSELREQKDKIFRTETALHQTKFNMLKYQVNPHFLFNSLNSIIGLIDEDKEKAKRIVEGLSDFFRLTLGNSNDPLITVGEEINRVKNYLDLEKVRYEDNLIVAFNINERAKKIKIPSLIINILVENAMKHGIKTSPMPLNILIDADIIVHTLIIRVSNSGKLLLSDNSAGQSTRLGLINVEERLAHLFPGSGHFSLYQSGNNVVAEIIVKGVQE